jgi:hypothetical protein
VHSQALSRHEEQSAGGRGKVTGNITTHLHAMPAEEGRTGLALHVSAVDGVWLHGHVAARTGPGVAVQVHEGVVIVLALDVPQPELVAGAGVVCLPPAPKAEVLSAPPTLHVVLHAAAPIRHLLAA